MTSLARLYSTWIMNQLRDIDPTSFDANIGDAFLAEKVYEFGSTILDAHAGMINTRMETMDQFHNVASNYIRVRDFKKLLLHTLKALEINLREWRVEDIDGEIREFHETLPLKTPPEKGKVGRPANPGKDIWEAWLREKKQLTLKFKTEIMERELAVHQLIRDLNNGNL